MTLVDMLGTITKTLARSLAPKLLLLAAAFAYLAPGYMAPHWSVGTTAEVIAIRPHAENSPPALMAKHGCWTGDAPKSMRGVLPGHVVVTVNGDATLGGERMVGKALEQIFNGTDHGLTVHGFCK